MLVDFLCHGTGTQKCFDLCVKDEEKKKNAKIVAFTFRAKTKRAEHSFKYIISRNGKEKVVKGYSFEFPYYYSYLKYNIFNDYCYDCKYARLERVGDITLGDFWKIQKFSPELKDQDGVSMLSINTQKGYSAIEKIKEKCMFYEYPIENAAENNEALCPCVDERCRKEKLKLAEILENKGEEALVERLRCPQVRKNLIYAKTPVIIKKIWNHIRGRA